MAMIHSFLPFPPKFRTSRAGNQFPFAWQELQLIRTDKWAEEVQRDWRRLRKASEAVRNDPDLVAACIDVSRGEAIKFAGEVGVGEGFAWCLVEGRVGRCWGWTERGKEGAR